MRRSLLISPLSVVICLCAWSVTVGPAQAQRNAERPSVLYHRGFDAHTRHSDRATRISVSDRAGGPHLAMVTSRISMHVSVGWNGNFRSGGAWTPVRISVHNAGMDAFEGAVDVPDGTPVSAVQERRSAFARYTARLVLPAGSTKSITLYLPGSDLQSELDAQVLQGGRIVCSARTFPVKYDDSEVTVGALAGDPIAVDWLHGLRPPGARPVFVAMTPQTVDSFPEVLANFDLIVISNVDTSRLDTGQTRALTQYVRNGGALVLVGGPNWQETLRSLPNELLPGTLSGTRPLPDLVGLGSLGFGRPPAASTTVSLLSHTRGAILAEERGVPLVVRTAIGYGAVTYLAFDPGLAPIFGWASASRLLGRITYGGALQATRRLSTVPGTDQPSLLQPSPGLVDLSSALTGGQSGPAPPVGLLAILLAGYVVAGLAGLGILRSKRRARKLWLGVPAFSVVAGLVALALPSAELRNVVPTLMAIDAKSSGTQPSPTLIYVGTTAAVGSLALTYDAPSLPSAILPGASPAGPSSNSTNAWQFQEGASTGVRMVRGVSAFRTTTILGGQVVSHVYVDAAGFLNGTVTNDTKLTLWRPSLKAGDAFLRLADLPPGTSAAIHMHPYVSAGHQEDRSTLFRMYGQPSLEGQNGGIASASSVDIRIQDALGALPGGDTLVRQSEVALVAWVMNLPLNIHASEAEMRSVSIVSAPISVGLPSGPFTISSGTIGTALVDQVPAKPVYACCASEPQAVYIGSGGSATFETDVPGRAGVKLSQLSLQVYGGGSDPSYTGYTDVPSGSTFAFDWSANRWAGVKFSNGHAVLSRPNRFVSSTGAVLIKLRSLSKLAELTISDPNRDIQVSASGTAVSGAQGE